MATRIYGCPPGAPLQVGSIVEAVGPTATSASIALVVDLATNLVTDGAGSRGIKLDEVLKAIDNIKAYLLQDQWPPA